MTTSRSRSRFLPALVALSFMIAGCSPTDIAYGLDPGELPGEWRAMHDGGAARLTLNDDGTFNAAAWPENLVCTSPGASTVDDLDWEGRSDFSGTWHSVSSDLSYALVFSIQQGPCDQTGWSSYVWSSGDTLEIKVFLTSVNDPDSASNDQIFWLRKSS